MAFFRFNRDKRGYEYFSLVEPVTNRRGKTRPRVLYWYRTPPNIRVGRAPFDDAVRRALEKQNPTVAFDWPKIIAAPIPSADVDRWRERRRTERAEKAARQHTPVAADLDDAGAETGDESISQEASPSAPPEGVQAPSLTGDQLRKRKRRRRMRGQHPDLQGRQGSLGDGEVDQPAVRAPDSAPASTPAPTDTSED